MSINKFAGVAITTSSKIMGVTGAAKFMGLAVAAPAAPTLDAYTGLVSWYKGPIAGATNGASLSGIGWPDSKGSHNFTDGQPTYYAAGLNGNATVNFSGGFANYIYTGGSDSSTLPITAVLVARVTDLSSDGTLVGSSSYAAFNLGYASNGSLGISGQASFAIGSSTAGSIVVNTWHVIVVVLTSSTWQTWVNGVSKGSGSGSYSFAAGRTFDLASTGGNAKLVGDIAEVGFYNTDRTADVAAITSGLQSKYAI